jgi:hypothetical protein
MDGKTYIISGTMEEHPIEWSETQAGLNNLLDLMDGDSWKRLMGDLFRHSAMTGWRIHVGAMETYDRERLRRFVFDGVGDELGSARFIFPVSLVGRSTNLTGGLVVTVQLTKGQRPTYTGFSIHT